MTYKVILSPKVQKQLRKLDKNVSRLIVKYLYKHVDGLSNPREKGKGLTANRSGQWCYRMGDYRVTCEIIDEEVVVLAVSCGRRKVTY